VISAVAVVLILTACGSHPSARLAHGVIEVRGGVRGSSLRHSVLGIAVGTRASDVRRKLGQPFATVASAGQSCWAYHASQPGTALDALDFCIERKSERVARILTGIHA
jgi:hypothetical protein